MANKTSVREFFTPLGIASGQHWPALRYGQQNNCRGKDSGPQLYKQLIIKKITTEGGMVEGVGGKFQT